MSQVNWLLNIDKRRGAWTGRAASQFNGPSMELALQAEQV